MNDFAVFILTHGRPDSVYTLKTLRRCGYTGKIFYIVDNEDKTVDKYIKNFGDKVVVFDKLQVSTTFDTGDNFDNRKTIVYARNACFEIAKKLGLKYFMQLDDDYTGFNISLDSNYEYSSALIKNLDFILMKMLDFYKSIPALSIAMAQTGDFIGGKNGSFGKNMSLRRKCMNSFLCCVDRPFQFVGRINEDVNTYTRFGSTGSLFLTIPALKLQQKSTQQNKGGMTETYLESGTYLKSFYSVMYHPSGVTIARMGPSKRIHHKVSWRYTVPCLINERHQKVADNG